MTFSSSVAPDFVCNVVTRLTRRVPLVEQELLTLPENLSSPRVLVGVRVTRSLVLCVCFVDRCPFVLFLLAIVLSVLLGFTDSGYPFGIFTLFFHLVRSYLSKLTCRETQASSYGTDWSSDCCLTPCEQF